MIPKSSLSACIRYCRDQIIHCGVDRGVEKWQGIKAPMPMLECFEVSFRALIPYTRIDLMQQVKPNVHWAEDQFVERICGMPLNPGESYKSWPYYNRDKEMRTENFGTQFTHTYMERFWPKYAGKANDKNTKALADSWNLEPKKGIRYEYGDLDDVINLLKEDRFTRHAYLPIFFPEDTGKEHRIPCTLGYLFYFVGPYLHTTYYIRSCDYLRHLRDDIYLACLLNHHVASRLDSLSMEVVPGYLTMHIANLHVFTHEKKLLEKEVNAELNEQGTTL